MIEQVELRPVQPSDAETLARLFTEQREFLAPFDPDRPESFFTVAGQRAELEQSVIQREADLWIASPNVASVEIPDTLQGLLLERIDRLPEESRRTLRVASVIGRQFGLTILERLLEAPPK